jgi:hypothetical protein
MYVANTGSFCVIVCLLFEISSAERFFVTNIFVQRATSGFGHDQDEEICVLLGSYAASIGNSLPTFRNKLSVRP